MNRPNPHELKRAVEAEHGGTATFVQAVPIRESHGGRTTWDGVVHIFNLAGHPQTTRGYAWSDQLQGGRQQIFAVLERETIASPRDAVRAVLSRRFGRGMDQV